MFKMMVTGENRTDQNRRRPHRQYFLRKVLLTSVDQNQQEMQDGRTSSISNVSFIILAFYFINILHVIVLISHPYTKHEKSMITINIDSIIRFYISKSVKCLFNLRNKN